MGEIRIVSPGKTRGYPCPVCKKNHGVTIFTTLISVALAQYEIMLTKVFDLWQGWYIYSMISFTTNRRFKLNI